MQNIAFCLKSGYASAIENSAQREGNDMEKSPNTRNEPPNNPVEKNEQRASQTFGEPVVRNRRTAQRQQKADNSLQEALEHLKSGGKETISALGAKIRPAVEDVMRRVKDGSLWKELRENTSLWQGVVYFLPFLLCFLAIGFREFWRTAAYFCVCYYLWQYQKGKLRRTRWDYLLLVFPVSLQLFSFIPQIVRQISYLQSYYLDSFLSWIVNSIPLTISMHLCILLFAWMRARTHNLLKAVRIVSIVLLVATGIALIVLVAMDLERARYYGIWSYFWSQVLLYLGHFGFGVMVLFFAKGRVRENDFSTQKLTDKDRWKPEMALLAYYVGFLGIHRKKLGYHKSARVLKSGFISVIATGILSLLFALLLSVSSSFTMMGFSLSMLRIISIISIIAAVYYGVTVLWAFVDMIRILAGNLKPATGEYLKSELAVLSDKNETDENTQ